MFKLVVDLTGLADLAQDFDAAARRAKAQSLLAIESAGVEEAPHLSGNLANAITTDVEQGEVYVSGAAPYGPFVHGGTGIYGPRGERIRPKDKKALYWRGALHPVASVKGIPPNPFMDRAAAQAAPKVAQIFERELSL